jgi:CubicO group peptidase (beta-lactamase class C family)
MKTFIEELVVRHDLYDADFICFKHGKIVEEVRLFHPAISQEDTPNIMVRIASISKLFVAIAIMQLRDKCLLQLDDSVDLFYPYKIINPYFKEIPITIKMLLTHTSSLSDTETLSVPFGETLYEIFDPKGKHYTTSMFLKDKDEPVKPGTKYHYYNTGFQLLAGIIEKLSEERFDHYIEHHILNPIGMIGSFNPNNSQIKQMIRPAFRKDQGLWKAQVDDVINMMDYQGYVLGTNGSLFSPQGGLRTNATELSKFMRFLMEGDDRILSQSSLDDMMRIHFAVNLHETTDHFSRHNGLGFNIITEDYFNRPIVDMTYRLVGHCGIAYGCLGIFFFDPANKNGVIFITRGHGKKIEAYEGLHSTYFNFQEEILTYIDQHIWRKS